MSEAVVLDGVSYESLKVAAKRVHYSRDYLSRLARDGKITAARIGRQWYVDPTSLETFVAQVQAEEAERKARLRAERKQELAQAEQRANVASPAAPVASPVTRSHSSALVAAVATLIVGVMAGTLAVDLAYFSPEVSRQLADTRVAQVSAIPPPPAAPTVASTETLPLEATTPPLQATPTVSVRSLSGTEAASLGVMVLGDVPATSSEALAELFSDPVTLRTSADGQTVAVIAGSTSTVPVVIVPTQVASSVSERGVEVTGNGP